MSQVRTASPHEVVVFCDGQVVARHARSWAKQGVISDPDHVATAAVLRREHTERRAHQQRRDERAARQHADGHTVVLRALPDHDALFGVDFTIAPGTSERRVDRTAPPALSLSPSTPSEATPS